MQTKKNQTKNQKKKLSGGNFNGYPEEEQQNTGLKYPDLVSPPAQDYKPVPQPNQMNTNYFDQQLKKLRLQIQQLRNSPVVSQKTLNQILMKINHFERRIGQLQKNAPYSTKQQLQELKANINIIRSSKSNSYLKLSNTTKVVTPRPFQQYVSKFITQTQDNSFQKQKQLNLQLHSNYFSQQAIMKQMQIIHNQLFQQPSQDFKNQFDDWRSVIFKAIVLKQGLQIFAFNDQKYVQYIIRTYIPWGMYFISPQRLFAQGFHKQNNAQWTIFQNKLHNFKYKIRNNNVKLYYKQKTVTPQQFQKTTLRKIAQQNLQRKAQSIAYRFVKLQKQYFDVKQKKIQANIINSL